MSHEQAALTAVESTVRVTHPGPGALTASSFDGLIGRQVHVHGLHPGQPDDPGQVHILTGVEVQSGPREVYDPDSHSWSTQDVPGAAAVLTIRTELPTVLDITRHVSINTRTPKARVHVQDQAGTALTHPDRPAFLDAPLHIGQTVWVGDTQYTVTDSTHPNRGDTGFVADGIDVQVATVQPAITAPAVQPVQ